MGGRRSYGATVIQHNNNTNADVDKDGTILEPAPFAQTVNTSILYEQGLNGQNIRKRLRK